MVNNSLRCDLKVVAADVGDVANQPDLTDNEPGTSVDSLPSETGTRFTVNLKPLIVFHHNGSIYTYNITIK